MQTVALTQKERRGHWSSIQNFFSLFLKIKEIDNIVQAKARLRFQKLTITAIHQVSLSSITSMRSLF
jgi:hypothetical protein